MYVSREKWWKRNHGLFLLRNVYGVRIYLCLQIYRVSPCIFVCALIELTKLNETVVRDFAGYFSDSVKKMLKFSTLSRIVKVYVIRPARNFFRVRRCFVFTAVYGKTKATCKCVTSPFWARFDESLASCVKMEIASGIIMYRAITRTISNLCVWYFFLLTYIQRI